MIYTVHHYTTSAGRVIPREVVTVSGLLDVACSVLGFQLCFNMSLVVFDCLVLVKDASVVFLVQQKQVMVTAVLCLNQDK